MDIKEKILVVEDEKSIQSFICTILTANGYDVISASSGSEAYSMITSHCPDLVILDLGLPDIDGLDILRAMRQWTLMPVIVVSARNYERDKVTALDIGADDYITKPFGASELLARIRTAIRHTRTATNAAVGQSGKFTTGGLTIDYAKRRVYVDGEEAETFEVMECLTAVSLEAGEHTVELRSWPWCVKYGLIISLTSLAIFCAVIVLDRLLGKKSDVIEFKAE